MLEPLKSKIPLNQMHKINDGKVFDSLGYEQFYQVISTVLPPEFTIVDLGCYIAAQAFLFENFVQYIGVDYYDYEPFDVDGYVAPQRFVSKNCYHIRLDIQSFFSTSDFKSLNLDKTYFLLSAVADQEAKELVLHHTKNACIFNPGKDIIAIGLYANEVKQALKTLQPQI